MSALATTFADLTVALTPRAVPTVADFFAWEARQTPRPYSHMAWALSMWGVRFDPADPLALLQSRLRGFKARDEAKASRGHWSFDANRLFAVSSMLALIDTFNAED